MVKRLNFIENSTVNNLKQSWDADRIGSYKTALDMAINQGLQQGDFLQPGPYLGIVLREEPTPSRDFPTAFKHWASSIFGFGSETGAPTPDPQKAYKVRIPELDACIPEPEEYCVSPEQVSKSQKYIDLHTTFISKDPNLPPAKAGDIVYVNYSDHRSRRDPEFLGRYWASQGDLYTKVGDPSAKPSAAYDKCANIDFGGAPDGSNFMSPYDQYTDGDRNWVVSDDRAIESSLVESNEPKNTYPRECSLFTTHFVDNTPDAEDEENLRFLEQEVIPRLLPALRETDGRFVVTSVYRSDELNSRVGGAIDKETGEPTSYHTKGLAVDFGGFAHPFPKKKRDAIMIAAAKKLREDRSKFPFLQTVIVELHRNHIHVDVRRNQSGSTKWRIQKGPDDWANLV